MITRFSHQRLGVACCILVFCVSGLLRADDGNWTSWRGPSGNGSIESGMFPHEFDADSVLWKAPLPGKGCSTPIVLDQTIYVSSAIEGEDGLLAFDWNGKELWRTEFGLEVAGKHRNGSGSNASPVTDGQAIYVYFKSGTFAAVELDGSIRWQKNIVCLYRNVPQCSSANELNSMAQFVGRRTLWNVSVKTHYFGITASHLFSPRNM